MPQSGIDNVLDRLFRKGTLDRLAEAEATEQFNVRSQGLPDMPPVGTLPQPPLPPVVSDAVTPSLTVPPPPPPPLPPTPSDAPDDITFAKDYAKQHGLSWEDDEQRGQAYKEAMREYERQYGAFQTVKTTFGTFGQLLFQPLKLLNPERGWATADWAISALDIIPGVGLAKVLKTKGLKETLKPLAELAGEVGKARKSAAAGAGAGKIARAANIRLDKFPEEVRELIKDFAAKNSELVQQARRGVIPDIDVATDAKRLVDDLGGDFNKLVKEWKPGQAWNAEEIVAVRGVLRGKVEEITNLQKLIKSGQDSTENMLRFTKSVAEHAQLQEVVHGITAEAGRSLRQFRNDALSALSSGDAARMGKILRQIGDKAKVGDIVDKLGKLDLSNDSQISSFIRSVFKPKLSDYITELFYNSILSGPKTHIINTISNAVNAAFSPVERLVSATVEVPRAFIGGEGRQRFFGEVGQDIFGLLRGVPEGARAALRTFIREAPLEATSASKFELPRAKAFTGKLGRVVNFPSDVLEAADAFFYGINKQVALRSQAYRIASMEGLKGVRLTERIAELIHSPTEDLLKAAHDISEYRLFRAPPGQVVRRVMSLRDAQLWGLKPLRFIIPFLRTPTNLVKYGLERSPLGILNPKIWANFIKGNPEFSDQVGRWIIGTSIAAGIASYVSDDKITGAVPRNAGERDRFYREGKIPYAIKIGDQWVSYQRLEPFNQAITQVAAVVDAIKNKEIDTKISDMVGKAASSIGRNFVSQTYMQGVQDLINAIEEPEIYGKTFAQRIVLGFTPYSSLSRTIEQIVSPEVEQPQNIIEAVEANIPLLSSRVQPRMTALGEPAVRVGLAWFPIAMSVEQKSPVIDEMKRLKVNVGFVGDSIWGIELTKAEKREYQELAGKLVGDAIQEQIKDPVYQKSTSDEWQKSQLQKAANKAREEASGQMLNKFYDDGRLTGDKRMVYEYRTAVDGIPEDKQSTFGLYYRETHPEVDAALNIEGVVRTVRSRAALSILTRRAEELGIPPETFPALQQGVSGGQPSGFGRLNTGGGSFGGARGGFSELIPAKQNPPTR